jgi:hypothetical protein
MTDTMNTTDLVAKKRSDLLLAIEKLLKKHSCVAGVLAVGSVATGHPRVDSDIDFIVFMDPVDLYIIPAESIWCPWDDTFHSIFVDDRKIQMEGLQLDAHFYDLRQWSSEQFAWPEYDRAGLANGWIAFDRNGELQRLIEKRTFYDEKTRTQRLDEFVLEVDYVLSDNTDEQLWDIYGPLVALSRVDAVLDAMVGALFAYNRQWRFFKDREMGFLCRLPWLPQDFQARMLGAMMTCEISRNGYLHKSRTIKGLSEEIIARLVSEGYYGAEPAPEAFRRTHAEPGRAWNMGEWNMKRKH